MLDPHVLTRIDVDAITVVQRTSNRQILDGHVRAVSRMNGPHSLVLHRELLQANIITLDHLNDARPARVSKVAQREAADDLAGADDCDVPSISRANHRAMAIAPNAFPADRHDWIVVL